MRTSSTLAATDLKTRRKRAMRRNLGVPREFPKDFERFAVRGEVAAALL